MGMRRGENDAGQRRYIYFGRKKMPEGRKTSLLSKASWRSRRLQDV